MQDTLNKLEYDILLEIANANKVEYPFIREHLPFIRVKSRENTGVGMFVNFDYANDKELNLKVSKVGGTPSAKKIVELDSLKYGLGFVLDIESGKLNYLELFTFDEVWDGKYDNYRFSET